MYYVFIITLSHLYQVAFSEGYREATIILTVVPFPTVDLIFHLLYHLEKMVLMYLK